jgi:23S rRNA pseudouridine2605 synthase
MEIRLQKVLAQAGVASRRKAEALIAEGRVDVNGAVVRELGTKVDPARDLIRVDGALLKDKERKVYYALYKPPGMVTTLSDPEGRPTVADCLRGIEERVFVVGRLDWDAEGALIATNDGELANRLMHPRYGAARTYLAKVKGEPDGATLEKLREGVTLEDGFARPESVEVQSPTPKNTWLKLVVKEGRPHLIKRLCAAIGHPVVRLFRPQYAGVSVEGMVPGTYRPLTQDEVAMLQRAGEGPVEAPTSQVIRLPARRHRAAPKRPVECDRQTANPAAQPQPVRAPAGRAQRFGSEGGQSRFGPMRGRFGPGQRPERAQGRGGAGRFDKGPSGFRSRAPDAAGRFKREGRPFETGAPGPRQSRFAPKRGRPFSGPGGSAGTSDRGGGTDERGAPDKDRGRALAGAGRFKREGRPFETGAPGPRQSRFAPKRGRPFSGPGGSAGASDRGRGTDERGAPDKDRGRAPAGAGRFKREGRPFETGAPGPRQSRFAPKRGRPFSGPGGSAGASDRGRGTGERGAPDKDLGAGRGFEKGPPKPWRKRLDQARPAFEPGRRPPPKRRGAGFEQARTSESSGTRPERGDYKAARSAQTEREPRNSRFEAPGGGAERPRFDRTKPKSADPRPFSERSPRGPAGKRPPRTPPRGRP